MRRSFLLAGPCRAGLLFLMTVVLELPAFAQSRTVPDPVSIGLSCGVTEVTGGHEIVLTVQLAILPRWHINAHETTDPYLTPAAVTLDSSGDVALRSITYPPSQFIKPGFSESELPLYEENAPIVVTAFVTDRVGRDSVAVQGIVQYQACNDATCLLPVRKPFKATVLLRRGQ